MAVALPVGLGLFPLGIAFGVVVVDAGLAWWWATVFTTVVYAGSLEFLLVGLAVTAAPLPEVALVALVVNVRHVFYALSFPLANVRGFLAKAYSTFSLTDEAYAVTTSPEARTWPSRRILGLQLGFQLIWVAGATVGALVGTALPLDRIQGMDFALTGLFVVLAIEAYRDRPDTGTAVAALACGTAGLLVAPDRMLPIAFTVLVALQILRTTRTRGEGARG
ncbi:MAG: branched-chain amino acid transporter permease [Acidimicrobiales bacterium]|nr:branched-chain amino acid transporter permease [Acidimicrobiales bacterium]